MSLAFLRERAAVKAFHALDPSFRQIVFYSEGSGDWPHLGPVITRLLTDHDQKLSYLTSGSDDPGLQIADERFRAFQVGSGTARTVLFRTIECGQFAMTLPDLGSLWLKRSVHPVHYVYLFHSMNSTHTAYRKAAFDNYDTILCVGPHHVDEIRRTEQVYRLKPKELVEHGSVKLDTILDQLGEKPRSGGDARAEVLVAPSWGDGSLIEQPVGDRLLDTIVGAGYRTILRLHPMTVRRLPQLANQFRRRYSNQPLFQLEVDMNAVDSWVRSGVMISDWSGAATEYAFALQKPVIYVDTPPKIRNAEWETVGAMPFESMIRQQIGTVVQPSEIHLLPALLEKALQGDATSTHDIKAIRSRSVFNVGASVQVAAQHLASWTARS